MLPDNQFIRYSLLTGIFLFTSPLNAMSLDLGLAGQFNAFVMGDMTASYSDVEGRLAVGGNLSLQHYAIGMQLDNSQGVRDDLIVGGALNFSDGRVYNGNARSGGTDSIERVGFYSDDDIGRPNGSYISGNPMDFNQIEGELTDKSRLWGNLSVNGLIDYADWGGLTLTGHDLNLNIFSISAEQLKNTTKFLLDIPNSAQALINVTGKSVTMQGFGFYREEDGVPVNDADGRIPDNAPPERHDGSLTQNILFNFIEAEILEASAIGIKGSILAPLANMIFYNVHIDGNLIVNSLSSKTGEYTGQVNYYPFMSMTETTEAIPATTSAIPEPPHFALFIIFLLALVIKTHKASHRMHTQRSD